MVWYFFEFELDCFIEPGEPTSKNLTFRKGSSSSSSVNARKTHEPLVSHFLKRTKGKDALFSFLLVRVVLFRHS